MADNYQTESVSVAGATFKSDDDGTAHWPYVKLAYGADNTYTIVGSTSSNPLPVALSDTDNAVLDTIDAVLDTINAKLVTGTVIGDVNLGATDNAVLDSIQAAVEIVDNTVYVDDADWTALTSSHNLIGGIYQSAPGSITDGDTGPIRLTANGAVHVSVVDASIAVTNAGLTELAAAINASQLDVNIATDSVGIGGGTQYAVDTALGATPTGTLAVAIRDDALSALTPVEGDAIGLRVDANGALWVIPSGTVTVDGSGVTQPVSGTVTANLSATDNAVLDSIDAAVNGTLAVGSHPVTNAGTFAVQVDGAALTALQLIDDTIYSEDAATPATIVGNAVLMERDDALSTLTPIEGDWVGLRSTAEGALWVQDFNSDAILADTASMDTNLTTIAGAVTGTEMQVDIVTLPASTNTIEVVGDVAHDAVAAGNPVAIAVRATNSIEGLTQVAAADASYITSDLNGCIVTRPHTTLEENISERVSDTAGTSTNLTNFAAGGAGIHNYITSATVWNSHATTSGYVDLRDGSAGSIVWTLPAPANSGCIQTFDPPLKFAANTAVAYDVSAAISTVIISFNGFQAQG